MTSIQPRVRIIFIEIEFDSSLSITKPVIYCDFITGGHAIRAHNEHAFGRVTLSIVTVPSFVWGSTASGYTREQCQRQQAEGKSIDRFMKAGNHWEVADIF